MSRSLEPRHPDTGWALRWSIQAGELLWRAAWPLTVALLVFNGAALLNLALSVYLWTTPLIVVVFFLLKAIPVLHLLYVVEVVMQEDGHRREQPVLSRAGLLLAAPFAFIDSMLFFVFTTMRMAAEGYQASGDVPEGVVDSTVLLLTTTARAHALGLATSLNTVVILGMFWPALVVSLGLSFVAFYRDVHRIMLARMPYLYIGFMAIGFGYGLVLARMPFWLVQVGAMYAMVWIYVGAREIFGGIRENGRRAVEVPDAVPAAG